MLSVSGLPDTTNQTTKNTALILQGAFLECCAVLGLSFQEKPIRRLLVGVSSTQSVVTMFKALRALVLRFRVFGF